jgi:hypothetical protein
LDTEKEEYKAMEFRPSYTDMLSVDQCAQSHSEMKAQVERLGMDKQHVHKSFHAMPKGPSKMGRGYNYDILANPAYCNRFDYVPTWQ